MCKIACIHSITDETSENVWKFAKQMSKSMTHIDDDGFGYAAVDSKGNVYGERWKDPKTAFADVPVSDLAKETIVKFKGMLKGGAKPVEYNNFGVKSDLPLRSIMLHARKATCANTLQNTHPFVHENGTVLIHNGIIHNLKELEMKVSTCDSETILNEYVKQGVADDIKKIQQMAWNLEGYYACGVFAKQADGRLIFDIFKDRGAKLAAYYIKELKSVIIGTPSGVYATGEGYGPVVSACQALDWKIISGFEVEDASIVRLDALTGEVIDRISFDSKYKEKEGAGKKGKHGKGGKGGGNNGSRHNNNHGFGDTANRWNRMISGPHNHSNPNGTGNNWNDKQRDEELDRMLTDMGETLYTGLNDDTPPVEVLPPIPQNLLSNSRIKTADEVAHALKHDFIMDGDGTWHRKGTGTDRGEL